MNTRPITTSPRCRTCRDRKIKCDGGYPVCTWCQTASLECHRLPAFELSWPPAKSRRAQQVSKFHSIVPHAGQNGQQRQFYFVNVLSDNVADHFLTPHLGSGRDSRSVFYVSRPFRDRFVKLPKQLPISIYSNVTLLGSESSHWISYFYHVASASLPQIDNDPTRIRDLLLRIAFNDSSASSRAVLYAILCISSLCRYANARESIHFKALSLRALQETPMEKSMSITQVLQHAATALLLCRSEIAMGEEANTLWAQYICNLRSVIRFAFGVAQVSDVLDSIEREGAAILFRYIHYHDIMAKFCISHWRHPAYIQKHMYPISIKKSPESACKLRVDHIMARLIRDSLYTEINLLDEVMHVANLEYPPSNYRYIKDPDGDPAVCTVTKVEEALLQALKTSKESIEEIVRACSSPQKDNSVLLDVGTICFQIQKFLFLRASWIYFLRTCRHVSGPSNEIFTVLESVFFMRPYIQRFSVRMMPFVLFILGIEAATEEQRRAILELMEESGPTKRGGIDEPELSLLQSSSFSTTAAYSPWSTQMDISSLLHAAWAQDDLHDESNGYLDYVTKIDWIISARPVLPALI